MKKTFFGGVRVTLAGLALSAAAATVSAQEPVPAEPAPAAAENGAWTYRPAVERGPSYTLAQLKAQQRGAQRMARLDAMRWYGFSGSRPTASAMPYTTMYSPAWQMPGGRPYAWHVSHHRPVVIIDHSTPYYR
jgi:hypothetical protein